MKTFRITYLTEVPDDETPDSITVMATAAVYLTNVTSSTPMMLDSVEEYVSPKKAKPRANGRPQ